MRSRTFALTAAGASAAAVAAALVRLKPLRRTTGEAAPSPETYRCECGQAFRVSGAGRHRVYWLAEAAEDDPLLSTQCPACERPLPAL